MIAPAREHDRTMIDWLTITHDDWEHLAWCLRGPRERRKTGVGTYRRAICDGHGTILASDGPHQRPFMLRMSGKALAAWRAERSIRELVGHLASQGVNCTRLDLARDTSGPCTPYRLQEHVESDRYVSRWQRFYYHSGKGNSGLTVECGSRKSAIMLRCYDKKAEREAAGEACPFGRLSRWELELKGSQSAGALRQIARLAPTLDETTGVEEWGLRRLQAAWLGSLLRLTVDPVDRASKNQSRAGVLPAWEAFLAGATDDVLAAGLDERSPAQQAYEIGRWAVRAWAATLALIHELGGDELVRALIECGRRRRRSAKHALIISCAHETLRALIRGIKGDAAA